MGRLLPGLALVIIATGCATTGEIVDQKAWEPARWERMRLAAKQARDRGDKAEAERHCVQALEYVGTSTVNNLYAYAALLKSLQRTDAEAAHARADKLRDVRSQRGGGYLGFEPSGELTGYAALLRGLGRGAEADAMRVLADAEDWAQQWHYARLQEQARGGDPRGKC
jgi:hypothetical protein